MGLFETLKRGLKKTRNAFAGGLLGIFRGRLDEDKLEEIEDGLLQADVGVRACVHIKRAERAS